MSESLHQLKTRLARISRLRQAAALLGWDQQTYMPPGAAAARAEQSATLSQLIHEMFVGEETGRLLEKAVAETQGVDPDSDDARLLAVLRRDYDRATRLPTELVTEIARHTALAQEVWQRARANSDFAAFAPALEKMLNLIRQEAEYLGYEQHPYNALLEGYEPGARQAEVAAMFAEMKPHLVALTQAIAASKNPIDDRLLYGHFPIERQRELTLHVVQSLGYDLQRGRQDEAAHPFCSDFSRDDVRITTRFSPEYLAQALYASLHEAGHAMYEQGSPPEYEATPLAGAASLGVHESQSRLWENLVGRSRPFCAYLFPQLQQTFPDQFGKADVEAYYRAINKVEPSLIRVEADEVTYNLHILLRFELECDLLTGQLTVSDLPEAWNARMKAYLGVTPPDDAHGVLQDIHWAIGLVGYFPTYTIGNLLSAQLWHAARQALPDLDAQIARGEFAPLLGWLRQNVHRYGRKYLPGELAVKATGEPLTSRYYVDYLTAKFRDLYSL
ncbi:MAG TPA: carboxypeptidase M32 [Chthonomonadaceae bacterium]|nr:carboxypeptidase M32 [Chthonomonadaceae bacterium]